MTRYAVDPTLHRFGTVAIGGTPLRLFRLTAGGAQVLERLVAGDDVPTSRLTRALLDAGAIHPDVTTEPVPNGSPNRYGPDDVTIVMPVLGAPGSVPDGAVVVDDGSEPPIPGATVRLDTNRGPAAARNAGLATVTTPLVAFVDADVWLPPDGFDRLLPHFDDPQVALVAPRVRSRTINGGVRDRYERRRGSLDLGELPGRVRIGARVSYVPSAAIVCRTDALRSVGGFDETLRFGEDVDLVWRLDAAGFAVRYDPSVEVEHEPRPTWRAWLRQRIDYGTSTAPLHARHPGAVAPARIGRWSAVVWALAVAGHPIIAATTACASVIPLARRLDPVPRRATTRLVLMSHLAAGTSLATATRRAWWPLVAVAALGSRRARLTLGTAFLLARSPVRAADDVAHSIGIWRSMIHQRSLGAIVPLPSRR